MKHLLKLGGMTPEEILHILDVADEYKRLHKDGVDPKNLQGKAVALVFAKNSTRTRPPRRGDRPDVLEAHADEIFDEAENRIYVEKAVLAVLLAGK